MCILDVLTMHVEVFGWIENQHELQLNMKSIVCINCFKSVILTWNIDCVRGKLLLQCLVTANEWYGSWHTATASARTSAKPQHVSRTYISIMKRHHNKRPNLILPVACQEVFSDVCRQDVLQQDPVEVLHGFNLLALFLELVLPQEV